MEFACRCLERFFRPIGASSSQQKGLDLRCERSITIAMLIRAAWPYLDPAPLAMSPLWGFGRDGA